MSSISEWSTKEEENTRLDELTLSGEGGQYINKIMCAVKAKEDEQDAKLDAVAGGLVFRGTKATYADLEAVEDPAVGDMYSVTGLGGENYAWDGVAWDSLGTSDANVVHKTGDETISGTKTFTSGIDINSKTVVNSDGNIVKKDNSGQITISGGTGDGTSSGAYVALFGVGSTAETGRAIVRTGKIDNQYGSLIANPSGTLSWNGQAIQTSSDERLKTALSKVPDAVLDAWAAVEWGQFNFLAAVERKKEDARLHLGLIAQRVKAVFEDRGLDACRYGILCYEQEEDLWMVRYEEALAMEAACQRRRADRLEQRVAVLEARLGID